jgi:hypothetical protein
MDKAQHQSRQTAIFMLIAGHVVAAIISAILADDQPAFSSGVFFALVVCQATLVGMWGGLGRTNGVLRLIGLATAIVLLATLLGLGLGDPDALMYFFVFIATSAVALPTWIVRLWKARIGHLGEEAPSREGLQFTIKHLMLLTFAVACLVTVGKALAPYVHGANIAMEVAVLAICFGAVALVSLWAMLGLGQPVVRIVVAVLIALGAGAIGGYVLDGPTDQIFWVFVALAQAVCVLGSLSVVRASGYRLLAR